MYSINLPLTKKNYPFNFLTPSYFKVDPDHGSNDTFILFTINYQYEIFYLIDPLCWEYSTFKIL